MKLPIPSNEPARLDALRDLDVLDTEPEEAFDRVTRLASQILDVPIVLVSLVDDARQWFKARVGLDAAETPRSQAFCAHTIMNPEVMVVPDAMQDHRFSANPLVLGGPEIRFYAGAPLQLDDDIRIGTLCAIDTTPRTLTADQQQVLADLASIVVDELFLRRRVAQLRAANEALEKSEYALRDANERLTQFAHITAHDLRAPLKTIVNLSDIVVGTANDASRPLIERIRAGAHNMESIVCGYRQLSSLTLEDESRQRTAVSSLVARAVGACETAIDVEVDGDHAIDCEPQLMTQLFVNLIANAEKHGAGGPIQVVCTSCEGEVTVVVSNPVFTDLKVDHTVFAPFRRLRADGDGTGLGLAIVKRVVTLHGGDVSASCDGGQFRVRFALPASELSAEGQAA